MNLARSILATLIYADIFNFPLTEDELFRYLVGRKTKLTPFRTTLQMLIKRKQVLYSSGYYLLPKKQKNIKQRLSYKKLDVQKMRKAREFASWLSKIPTVLFIGVSGALAMENAPSDDDIDFFIITAPKTLWTARLLMIVLADVLRIRRKPGEIQFADKVCLNMFVDSNNLQFTQKEQDLYTAHEIVQLKILVNKHETYERFIYANKWLTYLLPQAVVLQPFQKIKYTTRWAFIFNPVEQLSKWLQIKIMQKRRTSEVIRDTMLKFHPSDVRGKVMEEYRRRLKALVSS